MPTKSKKYHHNLHRHHRDLQEQQIMNSPNSSDSQSSQQQAGVPVPITSALRIIDGSTQQKISGVMVILMVIFVVAMIGFGVAYYGVKGNQGAVGLEKGENHGGIKDGSDEDVRNQGNNQVNQDVDKDYRKSGDEQRNVEEINRYPIQNILSKEEQLPLQNLSKQPQKSQQPLKSQQPVQYPSPQPLQPQQPLQYPSQQPLQPQPQQLLQPILQQSQTNLEQQLQNQQLIQQIPIQNWRKPTNPQKFQKLPEYWETPPDSQYSQMYDSAGKLITLRYRKPRIIVPEKVREEEVGGIGVIDQEAVKEYIDSQQDHASLIYSFIRHKQKSLSQQAEYHYYSKLYNIDQHHEQLPFCILSPYRNFYKHRDGQRYLSALQSQNYSNYQIVMIDDMSKDNSVDRLLVNVRQFPRVNNRLIIMQNADHTGALGNRDLATRKICKNQSIIVEIDADDYIIGRQVFNIYNTYYQEHPDIWFLYSNYIHIKKNVPTLGKNRPVSDDIFQNNDYRFHTNYWVTIHLRSYMKQLYMKIPINYLLEQPDKYYLWASDRFNMYAMTQLSGKKHMHFLPEEVYYYNFPDDAKRPDCQIIYIRESDYTCRQQTPLLPLENLEDEVRFKENNVIPDEIRASYEDFVRRLERCMKKFGLTKDTISK